MIRFAKTSQEQLTIGPEDAGRYMTLEQFQRARETAGYVYEIIDGFLTVSPTPKPPHDFWVSFPRKRLENYAATHSHSINWVSEGSEIAVPGRIGPTRPQPDVAAFHDYPEPFPTEWDEVFPRLVVEVISGRRPRKDVIRNRHLYWLVPQILEYLIIDPTKDNLQPTLIALIRRPGAADWEEQIIPYGKSFRSTALPKFALNLKDARRKRK